MYTSLEILMAESCTKHRHLFIQILIFFPSDVHRLRHRVPYFLLQFLLISGLVDDT